MNPMSSISVNAYFRGVCRIRGTGLNLWVSGPHPRLYNLKITLRQKTALISQYHPPFIALTVTELWLFTYTKADWSILMFEGLIS